MGVLFMHWATIWVKMEHLHWQPSRRASRAQGNIPDFILYCIILNNTQWQPSTKGWNQQSWLLSSTSKKPCKTYNQLGLQHLYPLKYLLVLLQIHLHVSTKQEEGYGLGVEWSMLKPKRSNLFNSLDLFFSLERLQSGATALLPEKFHCMGRTEQSGAFPEVTWLTQAFIGKTGHQQITPL